MLLDPNLTARCQMDQDGNGLDDEMEAQIAQCFVPEFRFDSREWTEPVVTEFGTIPPSLAPCEPVVGYSAYRIQGSSDDEIIIRFRFVALFRQDGGFLADDGTNFWCDDSHPGDSQGFHIDVRVTKGDVWRASFDKLDECAHPEFSGTRPVLYPSAGKHHWYCNPGTSAFVVDCGNVLPICPCADAHRGNGVVRTPSFLFRTSPSRLFIDSATAMNVCEYVRSNGQIQVPAPALQGTSLANLGFSGQFLETSFYGVDSAWSKLKPDAAFTFDADDDGSSEISFYQAAQNQIQARPVDACGLDKVATAADDSDTDGLTGKCDSDPQFRQKYVGIGEPGFPPVPEVGASWGDSSVPAYGGFWDQDQDRSANGFDECPSLASSSHGISNRWAEDVNWPPGVDGNHDLGHFQRGATCDPYPVSLTKWRKLFQRTNKCGSQLRVDVGSNAIITKTSAGRGASANDPYWDTLQAEAPKAWLGNVYRCACRHAVTGDPIPGAACVSDPDSECFRDDVGEADPGVFDGRGWRPVDRAGCSRNQTWCDSMPLAVPRFDVGRTSSGWFWHDETKSFPASSLTRHFAPGDVQSFDGTAASGQHERLTHEYAIWSLVELNTHLGLPWRPLVAPFRDPEDDPIKGAPLHDVLSSHSLRIRSSLSEQTAANLTSSHTELKPGIICNLLTPEQQLSKIEWWFGPDPVAPQRTDFTRGRAVVHDNTTFSSLAILRPAEGNYATGELGALAAASWVASSDVAIAPLGSNRAFTSPGPGLAQASAAERDPNAEPDVFVLERGVSDRPAQFARLAPVSVSDVSARYELVRLGELRGTISSDAQLVTDVEGRSAAVVDFFSGVVEGILPDGEAPLRHALPAELLNRTGAALALRGNNLLVAGGELGSALQSDLWLMDLYSGTYALLRSDLPARSRALLSVSPDGSHVLLAGGSDPSGSMHDDVWQLSSFAHFPGAAPPKRLYSDTSASALGFAHTALFFDPFADELLRVAYAPGEPEGLTLRARTPFGWEPLDDTGRIAQCAPEDPTGGKLCALETDWCSSVGRVACGAQNCEGSAGTLVAKAKLSPPAIAADVTDAGVWLARPHRVEHHAVAEPLALALTGSASLAKKALDIAARGTTALVATRRGVQLASLGGNGIELSPNLELCGAPLDVEPLGEDSWAVMTPLGLAIVGGGLNSELRVLSMSVLVPLGQHGKLIPLDLDPAKVWACKLAKKFGHFAGFLKGITELAPVDGSRLLVSTGKHVFDLRTTQGGAPTVAGLVHLKKPLWALRADASGGRAYGVGLGKKHRPVFDLRGERITLAGSHNVASWVKRRDGGTLRLKRHGAFAALARVVP